MSLNEQMEGHFAGEDSPAGAPRQEESTPTASATPLPRNVLDPRMSPVLAELDAIVQLQLMYPFDGPKALGVRAKKPARYIAAITSTAAYKLLYENRRKELGLAVGLPSIVERIETAAHLALDKLEEKIEASTDGEFVRRSFDSLMKARGEGGHAPPAATTINIDARHAAIMQVREDSLSRAREAGPYPPSAQLGHSPHEALPILQPAGVGLPVPEGSSHYPSPPRGGPKIIDLAGDDFREAEDTLQMLEDELKAIGG